MTQHDTIIAAVFDAIEEMNRGLAPGQRLEKNLETSLRTSSGALDSLGATMFLVDLERRLEGALGAHVPLVSGSVVGDEESPLRSVESLVQYIEAQVGYE